MAIDKGTKGGLVTTKRLVFRLEESTSLVQRHLEFSQTKQGYTRDACRSPAAVFTECAQFRAHLTARLAKGMNSEQI